MNSLHTMSASKHNNTAYSLIIKYQVWLSREQAHVGHLMVELYTVCCCVLKHSLCADYSFNYFLPL